MDKIDITNYVGPVINNAIRAGVTYVRNSNIKSLVLGISGGVDSALVAALARKICDKTNIKLIGKFLGIEGNKVGERERALHVGNESCHDYDSVYLGSAYSNLLQEVDYDLFRQRIGPDITHEEKIRCGNVKARIRMIYLYNLASKYNGLVLSTDNLTESLLGFWTLHGDVGDLGLIQNLWKTEVYYMAESIGGSCTACADATPTDGLGITNSDIDQLLPEWTPEMGNHKEAYKAVDDMLISELKGSSIDHAVIKRYNDTMFKRSNPLNISREELLG